MELPAYLLFSYCIWGSDGETKRWREHISQVCERLGSSLLGGSLDDRPEVPCLTLLQSVGCA